MTATVVVTPPTKLPVSVSDVKSAGRIEVDLMDAQLDEWLRAAVETAEAKTRRKLISTTLRTYFDCFSWSPAALKLPWGPLRSVTAVYYLDGDGAQQTLSAAEYWVDVVSMLGRVVLNPDKAWPSTQSRGQAVWVEYIAGYGDNPSSVPRSIRSWIIARVLTSNEFREQMGQGVSPLPYDFADGLLDPYTVQTL